MSRRPVRAVLALVAVVAGVLAIGEVDAGGEGELPGQTFLVSSGDDGTPMAVPRARFAPSMSGDGRFVVWPALIPSCPNPGIVRRAAGTDNCGNTVELKDRLTGEQRQIAELSTGDSSTEPVISRDGCTVVFRTSVALDPVNDVGNSRFDFYAQDACNPLPIPQLVTRGGPWAANFGLGSRASVSGDGRFVAFAYEGNGDGGPNDIAIADRDPDGNGNLFDTAPAVTVVVDLGGSEGSTEPALSDDGSRLAFRSDASPPGFPACNLIYCPDQIYLLDRAAGTFSLVSARGVAPGNDDSQDPAISGDGRVVAFVSEAQNLSDVALPACTPFPTQSNCTQRVYARDLAGEPELIALNESGAPSVDRDDGSPALSFDGTFVAFEHFGSDLVAANPPPADFEGADIILVSRVTRRPTRISVSPSGGPTTLDNDGTAISDNGRFVGFHAGEAQEVLGTALPEEQQIVVRDRQAVLTVGATDFGTVTVGDPPAVGTVTVTNTHGASFEIGGIGVDNGQFSVVGGSCALGTRLAPTQSCTVDMRFAPGSAGAHAGTLTISSVDGFDANPPGSGALTGVGDPPPTTTGSTTTTTTTTPPEEETTTTTAADEPAPVDSLSITPAQATFPATIVGATSVAQAFVVRNTGNRANPIEAADLIGANPGDYLVTTDGCAGVSLSPNSTCAIGVAFRPTATGARPASVRVEGRGNSSATATLAGGGSSSPTIVFSPAVARGGTVTIAIGGGFPASTTISLTFGPQGTPLSVTTDAAGSFRVSIVVRSGEVPGTLMLTAPGVPGQFDTISAPLLVVLGTYQPQSATGPAFGNASILSRG